jgi:hypothetical protein
MLSYGYQSRDPFGEKKVIMYGTKFGLSWELEAWMLRFKTSSTTRFLPMATMTITTENMRKMAMIVRVTMIMIVVMKMNVVTMVAMKLDKRRLWSCVVRMSSHLRWAYSGNRSLSNIGHFWFLISEFMLQVLWLRFKYYEFFLWFHHFFSTF